MRIYKTLTLNIRIYGYTDVYCGMVVKRLTIDELEQDIRLFIIGHRESLRPVNVKMLERLAGVHVDAIGRMFMQSFKDRSPSALVLIKAFAVLASHDFTYEKIELEISKKHHQLKAIKKYLETVDNVKLIEV